MTTSIFTKIINRDIPAHIIYEDEAVIAFLDINPVTPGHTLVVPKQQVEFVWDLPDEQYTHTMQVAKRLAIHLRDTMGVPYVGSQIIGVDVPHAHVHLVPFVHVKDFHAEPNPELAPPAEQLADLAAKLRLQS